MQTLECGPEQGPLILMFSSVWLLSSSYQHLLEYPYIHGRKGQNIIVLPLRQCGVHKIHRDVAFLESLPLFIFTTFCFAQCL